MVTKKVIKECQKDFEKRLKNGEFEPTIKENFFKKMIDKIFRLNFNIF